MSRIAIFRAGTHVAHDGRQVAFSEDDLKQIAESYDPKLLEAALVVGHPKTNDPAYGYAKSLSVEDGVLYAEPHQVDPQFAELVNAGRFKRVSSSIYLENSPGNPTPGKKYLRHIGFLGAMPPSVKGLPSVQFAEDDGALEFATPLGGIGLHIVDIFQRLRDYFVERDGAEAADKIIPQWQIRSIDESMNREERAAAVAYSEPLETDMSKQNDDTQIAAKQAELEERERKLADREAKARRDDAIEFAEQLAKDGKLLPREKGPIVELLLALSDDTTVEFAEGDDQVKKPAVETLRSFLKDLPKRLDFSEKSKSEEEEGAVEFAAPAGMTVDTQALELHARASAYQREHNVSYVEAVRAVRQ